MKTNVILKAVVMVAVVMASVLNFSANAMNPTDYVKNEEMSGELVTARTIFRNEDGYLFRHLRYTYGYDNENRVISKEASKWDSVKEAWVPYFKLDIEYTGDEVSLSYARWNSKDNAYNDNIETSLGFHSFHSIVFWGIFIFFIVSLQTNWINNVKSNI
ncbi:DUF3836 domain-containing protein [Bacteroides caecigallinarum]|uniref:DUF3836 domain-containing protein n=1 Tax=Bacteroides caecigallinarum TaxID=1411144 RepID=UPI001F19806D|nr:DUF3836 domain-containing protein [Bacteroides caecigallinarum]MDN0052962.1 DUF3836 domain-containing protein [Bacteroides caecigallinarum]MDN0072151.1 DUF3836 domain-containing protein [Bacteroides caecigallinarum]